MKAMKLMQLLSICAALVVLSPSGHVRADVIGPINATNVNWQQVGVYRYQGAGNQSFFLDFPFMDVTYVDFRMPNQCGLRLTPTFLGTGMNGGIGARLLSFQYARDGFADAIYQLGYQPGSRLRRIAINLYSPYYYGPESGCVVSVWISLASSTPVRPQPLPLPQPVNPNPIQPEEPTLPPLPGHPSNPGPGSNPGIGSNPGTGSNPGVGEIPPLPQP